ncbi:MAG: hypothetical protein ACRDT6_11275 [Micromonosporaceae bacterium]
MSTPLVTVSLNGCDNVGKTTQLRWLAAAMPDASLVGTIDRWHPRWMEVSAGDFARWWFSDSTTEEHVALVLDSHAARLCARSAVALEDRGYPMLVAVCAATAAVKENLSERDALERVTRMVTTRDVLSRRSVHVLLRHSSDPAREAALALQRDAQEPSEVYAAYQLALANILEIQVGEGRYDAVVVRGDRPILDIQRDIRLAVAASRVTVDQLPEVVPERVWVLGGLSESGKSTVGELLRDEHGVTRLKIGYLLDVAAARARISDPYEQWSEPEEAERLAEELLRFTSATKAPRISLESAHRYEATVHLRRVLGADRCHVVYVDAGQSERAGRTAETTAQLNRRDTIKTERGAARLADAADWVIRNNGSLAVLKLAVARLAAREDGSVQRLESGKPAPRIGPWLRTAVDHLVDDEVVAVVATGTTSGAGWLDGWSDVDLLVVRNTLPAAWLRQAHERLGAPADLKVGLSCFTTSEVEARLVPPRVIHALRRLHQERQGLLFCRAGYRLPFPPLPVSDHMSRGDLGLALMVLRRLVSVSDVDVRAVYKHVLLVMKILLRACGTELDAHHAVCTEFARRFPDADIKLPDPDQLKAVIACRQPTTTLRQLIAAASRILDFLAEFDSALQPGTERP